MGNIFGKRTGARANEQKQSLLANDSLGNLPLAPVTASRSDNTPRAASSQQPPPRSYSLLPLPPANRSSSGESKPSPLSRSRQRTGDSALTIIEENSLYDFLPERTVENPTPLSSDDEDEKQQPVPIPLRRVTTRASSDGRSVSPEGLEEVLTNRSGNKAARTLLKTISDQTRSLSGLEYSILILSLLTAAASASTGKDFAENMLKNVFHTDKPGAIAIAATAAIAPQFCLSFNSAINIWSNFVRSLRRDSLKKICADFWDIFGIFCIVAPSTLPTAKMGYDTFKNLLPHDPLIALCVFRSFSALGTNADFLMQKRTNVSDNLPIITLLRTAQKRLHDLTKKESYFGAQNKLYNPFISALNGSDNKKGLFASLTAKTDKGTEPAKEIDNIIKRLLEITDVAIANEREEKTSANEALYDDDFSESEEEEAKPSPLAQLIQRTENQPPEQKEEPEQKESCWQRAKKRANNLFFGSDTLSAVKRVSYFFAIPASLTNLNAGFKVPALFGASPTLPVDIFKLFNGFDSELLRTWSLGSLFGGFSLYVNSIINSTAVARILNKVISIRDEGFTAHFRNYNYKDWIRLIVLTLLGTGSGISNGGSAFKYPFIDFEPVAVANALFNGIVFTCLSAMAVNGFINTAQNWWDQKILSNAITYPGSLHEYFNSLSSEEEKITLIKLLDSYLATCFNVLIGHFNTHSDEESMQKILTRATLRELKSRFDVASLQGAANEEKSAGASTARPTNLPRSASQFFQPPRQYHDRPIVPPLPKHPEPLSPAHRERSITG